MFDPNDQYICNYKRIQVLCKEHYIPFRNQAFNQFVDALKTRNFDKSVQRQFLVKKKENNFMKKALNVITANIQFPKLNFI